MKNIFFTKQNEKKKNGKKGRARTYQLGIF